MDPNKKPKSKSATISHIDKYKSMMKGIDFMANDIDEAADIFNDVRSDKCRDFLVKSFTTLNPRFHYLSLPNGESIGRELVKVARIFHLYPPNAVSESEIFDGLSPDDIDSFWMKLFRVCRTHADSSDLGDEHEFKEYPFTDVKQSEKYFDYKISTGTQKLSAAQVNEEISSWLTLDAVTTDSTVGREPEQVGEESETEAVDMVKLINDIRYTSKVIDTNVVKSSKLSRSEENYEEFFLDFNSVVKEVMSFKDNLDLINSCVIDEIANSVTSYAGSQWLSNNAQMRRCNELMESIRQMRKL